MPTTHSEKKILGHIDCPTCGARNGMRITHDKNGEPFGYCEANCSQQLRIGGDARRVRAFVDRYPWALPPPVSVPKTVPDTAPAPPAPVPVPVQVPPKKAKPASPFDVLGQFIK